MTKISVELGYYPTDGDQLAVDVDTDDVENHVRLDASGLKAALDGIDRAATLLYPDEARALASVLLAQADAAER